MVLDDASPPAGSFSGENTSTNAPARTSITNAPGLMAGLRVNPESIVRPDPFTLYLGFFGNNAWMRQVGDSVFSRLQGTRVLTGRGATQEELDAFCYHATQSLYYGRVGLPVSTIAGGIIQYRKVAQETPGLTFSQRFITMLHMARADPSHFWPQAGRVGFRVFFIASCGWMVSSVASTYTGMSSLITDPKLGQWREDTKMQKDEDIRKRKAEAANSPFQNIKLRREVMEKVIRDLTGNSGYDEYQTQPQYQEQYSYDAPAENQSTYDTSQSEYRSPRPGYGSAPAPRSSGQKNSSTDFFLGGSQDDDASPTAPEYRNSNPDGSAMSAWDRIRAQNPPPRPQSSTRQTPTAGWGQVEAQSPPADAVPDGARDRYDFDRRREKEQAQSDFDKMMENERNASGGATDGPSRRDWSS